MENGSQRDSPEANGALLALTGLMLKKESELSSGNCSRLRGRDRFAKQILCLATRPQPVGKTGDPRKSCMLNEDFTEVEWVRQTDQVLVIKDRCSARVAAPVPKEPEQLPGPNRARIVQERASTPLRLHRRQSWGKKEST